MHSKPLAFILAAMIGGAVVVGGSAAQAQSLQVGPGGVGVDLRSPGERARDREMRREERRAFEREQERRERRAMRRDRYDGCREITVTERNRYGERVTRTRREC